MASINQLFARYTRLLQEYGANSIIAERFRKQHEKSADFCVLARRARNAKAAAEDGNPCDVAVVTLSSGPVPNFSFLMS